MQRLTKGFVESPLGPLGLVASDDGLVAVDLPYRIDRDSPAADRHHAVLDLAARELAAYFAGSLLDFTVPLGPPGTPFQHEVWAALTRIPYGEVRSYADIARAVDRPNAFRAVGAANGRNPIAIIVPCHRVIGSDGSLTGYAGGLEFKSWLLAHERSVRPASLSDARQLSLPG